MLNCDKRNQTIPEKKVEKIRILDTNGKVLFEGGNTVKEAVELAVVASICLEGACLKGVNLRGVCLEGVNFKGVNLEGARLEGANLEGANLKGTNLEGANLEGANLEGANLEGAKTSSCTVNFSPEEYEQAKAFVEGLKL